jgi:YD repeat-containing protein
MFETITKLSQEMLSLQADGTYCTDRVPLMLGRGGQRNQDGTATLRDKDGTVRTFNAQGFITAITDRNGNTVTIVRTGAEIREIRQPGGRALLVQSSGGVIQQITDPLGRTVKYTYESPPVPYAVLRLRTVTNPAGGTTTYSYVPAARPYFVESITDARGITYLTNQYCTGSGCPTDPAVPPRPWRTAASPALTTL